MYQDITLVRNLFVEEPEVQFVKARPIGRPVVWCDRSGGCIALLFEGEGGVYYVQEIHYHTDPIRTFYQFTVHRSVEDAIINGIANGLEPNQFEEVFRKLL